MPLGLLPAAIYGVGSAAAFACNGDERGEAVAIVTAIVLSGIAGAVIAYLKPSGLLGAAVGAALVASLVMLLGHTSRFPFADAGLLGALVAVGELCGAACQATVAYLRRSTQ